ncbi:MAG: hypothetical protein QXO57_02515 [Candidatus Aenigmatarchaeota archaeon]
MKLIEISLLLLLIFILGLILWFSKIWNLDKIDKLCLENNFTYYIKKGKNYYCCSLYENSSPEGLDIEFCKNVELIK